MFAKVIVDIRHEEVNHAFDYIVPRSFEDFLVRGMRVMVPFGPQTRLGYVVDIIDLSDTATKEIIEVLDVVPTLSDELFLIVEKIIQTQPALFASVFMTVIPAELAVNYQKIAKLIVESSCPLDLKPYFDRHGVWKLLQRDQIHYPRLKRLSDKGILSIETSIKAKESIKMETAYTFNSNHHYQRISHYKALDELLRDKNQISRKELLSSGFSSSQISTLLKHEVLQSVEQEVKRDIHHVFETIHHEVTLNNEQKQAINAIKKSLNEPNIFLLKGITGSGKTEVYMNVMETVIQSGKQVLFLVPEITLIGPMAQHLKSRFKDVAIYHSGLSKGERFDQYRMVKNQEASMLLGTRSAVFLPLEQLGLIIMDEEHDDAYQQTEGVIYHAKDIAILKSKYHHVPLILGSATPSIVSMYQADRGHYECLELTKRPKALPMPTIEFIDMKKELKNQNTSIFSSALLSKIQDKLVKKEQTLLLFNRKGYAPFVLCRGCGHVPVCPHCDISLTYYKDKQTLKCHYCGFEQPYDASCMMCHEPKVKEIGVGIEYVTEQLKKVLPKARVLRMDQNVTKTKGSHELIWHQFLNEEADILVGTQMIAKGLDFPKVTLVGVLMADMLLKVPSYRSAEQTYMLLSQVTGRSGRFLPGEAIIQGYDLNHYAIRSVSESYEKFYQEALYSRKLSNYPPFINHAQLLIEGISFLKTYQVAFLLKKKMIELSITAIGPAPALIKKIKDHHRFTVTLKYQEIDMQHMFEVIKTLETNDIKITFYPTLDIQ
jgi:primosomal protein N' (replication factor Y) (superfamily II helicase)